VSKRLCIAQPSQSPAGCCAPGGKARAKELSTFAALFKALGDETRLSILGYLLAKRDALCVCHIEDYVKALSQPTISHHLRLLREAGLVTAERRGTWIYYSVNQAARDRLAAFVALLDS
jgi:ArsR family transcriptional regulator